MHCASCETNSFVNSVCSYCGAAGGHREDPSTNNTWASTLEQVRLPIRRTSHTRAFAAPPLTPAKARRRPLTIVVIAAGALFLVLAVTWLVLAERNIRAQISRFRSASLVVEEARKNSFDGSRPRVAIHFNALTGYVEAFDRTKPEMAAAIGRLAEGDGMGLWTEHRRMTIVAELDGQLRLEKERADASRSALDAERSHHFQVISATEDCRARRAHAVRALTPATDEDAYTTELASLSEGVAELHRMSLEIEQAPTMDAIRRALCVGMVQDLEPERLALESRAASMRSAQALLSDYKNAVKAELLGTRGLIVVLDEIAGTIRPAVNFVFTRSVPFRDFMHEVNELLPLSGLGLVLGTPGKPATMLSIAASFDPQIEQAGEFFLFGCTAIEILHEEVGLIAARITPLSAATSAFLATNSRLDMLLLIGAALSAASYFEMHSTMFDPALENIGRLRPYVGILKSAAADIENTIARSVFVALSGKAAELIEIAEVPLLSGRTYIIDAGASLRSLDALEQAYRTKIESLK